MVKEAIPQNLVGYFREDEPIWVMTNNLTEKQDIEDGFNRESVAIRTIDDLLIQAENSLKNGTPHSSLVVTASLPAELEMNIGQVIAAVNLMPQVKVYEINRDKIFEASVELGTIRQLIVLSKERTRSSQIQQFTDPSDKQASLLRSLEEDLIIVRSDLQKSKEEVDNLNEDKKLLAVKLKELASEIKLKYLPESQRNKKLIEQLERSISDTRIQLEKEQEKSKQYMLEKDQANNEKRDLSYDVRALERTIKSREEQIDRLRANISRLEEEVQQVILERDKILNTMVEEESMILLKTKLDEETEKNRQLSNELDDTRITLSGKSLEVRDLENQIQTLRTGSQTIQAMGRTKLLDTQVLSRADLIYIKVIDNLPYHRMAVSMLYDLLYRRYDSKSLMIVIKNDEGLDNEKFKGINILGDLTELGVKDRIVRLFPSSTMFTGLQNVERDTNLIFVVDYIQSTNYYLDTKARSHFMTMVQKPETLEQISGLKGSPLTLGSKSIFDLSYDHSIGSSAFQENRHDTLLYKVSLWTRKLNILN